MSLLGVLGDQLAILPPHSIPGLTSLLNTLSLMYFTVPPPSDTHRAVFSPSIVQYSPPPHVGPGWDQGHHQDVLGQHLLVQGVVQ